jgi:hypothetical protein
MRTGSFLNALFKGKYRSEAGWFSVSASVPLISMNADRAARRIVEAVRHGKAVVTLGLPARFARLVSAVVPGLTAEAMGLVNRMLPSTTSSAERFFRSRQRAEPGYLHQRKSWARSGMTTMGEKAAEQNNEKIG